MVIYRVGIGKNILTTLVKTFINDKISRKYRRMLIKNNLIPMIIFGSKILGM